MPWILCSRHVIPSVPVAVRAQRIGVILGIMERRAVRPADVQNVRLMRRVPVATGQHSFAPRDTIKVAVLVPIARITGQRLARAQHRYPGAISPAEPQGQIPQVRSSMLEIVITDAWLYM